MGRKAIVQICKDCECEFETTGTYAFRCPECALKHKKKHRKEHDAEYKARYRAKKRKKDMETGVVPKATLDMTIMEAKAKGMTYGKLQALRYMEQQKGILND